MNFRKIPLHRQKIHVGLWGSPNIESKGCKAAMTKKAKTASAKKTEKKKPRKKRKSYPRKIGDEQTVGVLEGPVRSLISSHFLNAPD